MRKFLLLPLFFLCSSAIYSQKKQAIPANAGIKTETLSGLKLRSIGPALTSGRIADIAVNPEKTQEFYLGVASGGVWKTTNAGTTFQPIFDDQASFSIGCVSLAPSNPHTVWVGSGENNNQRSVAYGDGVYKSTDGGASWKNMGLKNSEHIGMFAIHPEDANTVYVAAYGPLWASGGDRGIYKTTDGGENWIKSLDVSENTGFNEVHMDPRDPNTLYATAHQRRRHVFTYIDGGPETAIYKTTDAGKTWRKLESGLPKGDKGRIGMDISPANPDVIYAMIAAPEKGGFFRSNDRGESWKKMSDHQTSGNYYQEIICDPLDVNKVFSMDTWLHHTADGGKTFVESGEKSKHVDNHCIWIDPSNTDHWRVGCDGGLYETWNAAGDWHYFPNLPITQFYKVALDNDKPFYNVYGGTQDNNTQGGPSRTLSDHGIMNSDWYITNGGDGFEPQIDPTNPDIVYGQAQYGWLVRYDRKSGERVSIQPQPKKGEEAFRWNWDAPLLISPHNPSRLYFAANVLFKSEDRGQSWETISGDLTQQIDRNTLPVMGRVWEAEAIAKNESTSIYGNCVAIDESPIAAGTIYIGTDDGLIQVTRDNGKNWKKISAFAGVPAKTYVSMIRASQHDANTVYAVFNNHKNGDFKPYVLKSLNSGDTWTSIAGNLPKSGPVHAIAQDHTDQNLLFVGTEFGLFYSNDGGGNWTQLKAGLPTIAVRDLAIQQRENDLVLATFGRGFYVLDDYTPLRTINKDLLAQSAHIFPVKPALQYIPSDRMGGSGKGHMGESYFLSENPPFGAVFTFYVGDSIRGLKDTRLKANEALKKDGKDIAYPDLETLRQEDRSTDPFLLFVIRDSEGKAIRKIKTGTEMGVRRLAWDLRHTTTEPIRLKPKEVGRYDSAEEGMLALPGTYTAGIWKFTNGSFTEFAKPVSFEVVPLNNQTIQPVDLAAAKEFQQEAAELQRKVSGQKALYRENKEKLDYIEQAVLNYPSVPLQLSGELSRLADLQYANKLAIWGDETRSKREFETLPGLSERVGLAVYSTWYNTSEPTQTAQSQLSYSREIYEEVAVRTAEVTMEIAKIEKQLLDLKVPYTPGRSEWGEE